MNARHTRDLSRGIRNAVEQERRTRQVDEPDEDRQEDRDPESEFDEALTACASRPNAEHRHGVIVTLRDRVAVPPRFETTRTIV